MGGQTPRAGTRCARKPSRGRSNWASSRLTRAFDAPFQWTKQVASHFGGTDNGLVISWPARIQENAGIRTQFHHVIDIVPTIYDTVGITPPSDGGRVECNLFN